MVKRLFLFFFSFVFISSGCEKKEKDITPPETTITSYPEHLTNSTFARFEFACNEDHCIFQCQLYPAHSEFCSSPKTYNELSEGSHIFYVWAIDSAGNVDRTPASWKWTIDLTPPETTITSQPSNPSGSLSAEFEFTCNEPPCTYECLLDNGEWENCTSSIEYTGLSEGFHTFNVRAIDLAGNKDKSPASYTWRILIMPLLWSYTTGDYVASSPSIADIDNDGKPEVIIGSGDSYLYALNGENGSVLWAYQTNGGVTSSPAIADIDNDGKLEVVIGDNKVYAVNGEDGTLLWSITSGQWDSVYSSPSIGDLNNDGKPEVIVGCWDNHLYVLNGEDGSQLWVYTTTIDVKGSPSLADIDNDGKLEVVFGTRDGIYALNGEDGSVLWEYWEGGNEGSPPSIADIDNDGKPEIVIGVGHILTALNGEDGSVLWSYNMGGDTVYPAVGDIDNDGKLEIVIGVMNNNLKSYTLALNGEDGSLLWVKEGPDGAPSIADIDNDGKLEVVIGSFWKALYALNGEDGSLLWIFETESYVETSPAITDIDNDGKLEVVFGSYDKKIYTIKTSSPVPPPNLLPWPKFKHDVKNTGLYTGDPYPAW
jgi:outer membrane protein assembly factor BamB